LLEDLSPSVHVHKRFGEEIEIQYFPSNVALECSLVREMKVEQGTVKDWQKLCVFHYRGHKTSVPRKIFRLVRGGELCGVIVYCYPPPACYGRRMVLSRMSMQELNAKLSTINRLVIHPKYRTVGLGAKMIRETLLLAGTPCVELIAVMAKFSPFAEKAGMRKIAEQESIETVSKVSRVLLGLGFDLQLLGSERYVKAKLENLAPEQLSKVREAFVKSSHPRFKKEFASSRHQPFGVTSDYIRSVENADSAKLAKLIKLVGMLLQTKVYLFWKRPGKRTT
jgi:hypothetical protein